MHITRILGLHYNLKSCVVILVCFGLLSSALLGNGCSDDDGTVTDQAPTLETQESGITPEPGLIELDIALLEEQIHNLVNAERMTANLPALTLDAELSAIARDHSQDMAEQGFFNHTNLDGYEPLDRCRQGGFNVREISTEEQGYRFGCAENLYQTNLQKADAEAESDNADSLYYTEEELATIVVLGWMESELDRQNLLADFWITEGIGIAISADKQVLVTQSFN